MFGVRALRVTAILRVSVMSAVLTATALAAALPVLATAQPATAATSQKPGHGTQDHGGRTAGPAAPSTAQAGAAASTAPQPTTPAAGCLKPGVPLCMDDQSTFLSADKMSSCQGEVKDYVDKSMAYLTCLNEENVATGRELSRNVDRFNCRLSGRKGCAN